MWMLIFVSVVINTVTGDVFPSDVVFNKCCLKNQSLLRVTDSEDAESFYKCVDRDIAFTNYSTSITPLILGNNVEVKYGIPEDCNELQYEMLSLSTIGDEVKGTLNENCYDRLELEVVNTTLKPYIPKVVALRCIKNDTERTSEINFINRLRKCCPRGQSYDTNFHVCRKVYTENTEEYLLTQLDLNNIYEVDHGLSCKADEYDVELKEKVFSMTIEGSTLNVKKRTESDNEQILSGQWCIDRDYNTEDLVARVCTRDCSKYGAYCLRKCCPVGQHFRPRRCGSFASVCVPTEDDVLFDLTDYLEPLQHQKSDIAGIL